MSISRRLLVAALRQLPAGSLAIRHKDGSLDSFGDGRPYLTIVIRHPRAYHRLLINPSMSLGESYMDGDIDIEGDLDELPRLAFEVGNAISALKLYVRSDHHFGQPLDVSNGTYNITTTSATTSTRCGLISP